MKNIRVQLLASHLVLVLLMVVVLTGAAFNFIHLGRSIDRILKNNYTSVIAAQNMKETLERQDSAVTFFLDGQTQKARHQYQTNWPLFQQAYQVEANDITEPGEGKIADDIGREFGAYRAAIEKLLYASPSIPPSEARAYYFGTLEPAFSRLKDQAQAVLDLNQNAILKADNGAKAEARRASLMGIGVTVGAFLLAIPLAFRTISLALRPLRSLAWQAEEVGVGHLNQTIELHRTDEIGALAASFNQMSQKLREARRIEEERLLRAEQMAAAALANLYDPVIVTDAACRIVLLNQAAVGLFGPIEGAAGRPIAEVIRDHRIVEAAERAVSHDHISAEEGDASFVTIQTDDTHRAYRLRANPMRADDGSLLGAVAVLEDVTHLRELDRLKSEFIGVASHELRTPVTSLLLSVQLMEEGIVGPLSPKQMEIVAAQKADLERLERMMRDLLDVTRLEAGVTPPRFEIVSPAELVSGALDTVASQAESRGIGLLRYIGQGVPDVRADRAQIIRVLVNLLNNAIRHTAEGEVDVEAVSEDSRVAFTVRDTGVGIPADSLPHIFERFVQVPGATRGGAGLGLSIARTIVIAHDGEISVQSEPGKGTAVTFTLPAGVAKLVDARKE